LRNQKGTVGERRPFFHLIHRSPLEFGNFEQGDFFIVRLLKIKRDQIPLMKTQIKLLLRKPFDPKILAQHPNVIGTEQGYGIHQKNQNHHEAKLCFHLQKNLINRNLRFYYSIFGKFTDKSSDTRRNNKYL
jgi:hypothetical protein